MPSAVDRRAFVALCAAMGIPVRTPRPGTPAASPSGRSGPAGPLTKEQVTAAAALIGLEFTDAELTLMLRALESQLAGYVAIRKVPLANPVAPAFRFDPVPIGKLPVPQPDTTLKRSSAPKRPLPTAEGDWAFAGVAALAEHIRRGAVTSRALTERALARLRAHDPALHCVVTLTAERALAQADLLDAEARRGTFRGPLHGIPYGVKDLFSVPGYPTTWGSPIYRDQVLNQTAAVVERLDAAGAVLVAKTSLGEFAQGDVWFGGMTRNPWNTEVGSSGSSAGSASGVSAGLFPFAIGTETLGSIVSPCSRCGVSGLRPTFGRVSRHGAMALSWTMDKVGPIARSAEDLALVFAAIHGADPRDPSSRSLPFSFDPTLPLSRIRIGVHPAMSKTPTAGNAQAEAAAALNRSVLDGLMAQGATWQPVEWPEDLPSGIAGLIIDVESAAAFDELTRNNLDDQMVQQTAGAWPNSFRAGRLIPAVEYVQANRVRTKLIEELDALYATVDVVVAPTNAGSVLSATNLSGHPTVVVPSGFTASGQPRAVTFVAALWREDLALRVAHAWQAASDVQTRRPPGFS
ncbi:MAG: amidase [Gemmatimonadota bacterium]